MDKVTWNTVTPTKRYKYTLKFLQEVLPAPAVVLDLGVRNPFSEIMEENGYTVYNTGGEDLDELSELIKSKEVDAVTAFEILEHLLNPYSLLKVIESKKLVTTIPMRLWFASAYKSKTDMWDRHYHEFEDWQFDWLLEKTGWVAKKSLKWTSPIKKIGFRPLLRQFTPRYYAVYAERKSE